MEILEKDIKAAKQRLEKFIARKLVWNIVWLVFTGLLIFRLIINYPLMEKHFSGQDIVMIYLIIIVPLITYTWNRLKFFLEIIRMTPETFILRYGILLVSSPEGFKK